MRKHLHDQAEHNLPAQQQPLDPTGRSQQSHGPDQGPQPAAHTDQQRAALSSPTPTPTSLNTNDVTDSRHPKYAYCQGQIVRRSTQ